MKRWPRITLLALFVGLLTLQLYQGVQRLGAIRSERRREVVDGMQRAQALLAHELRARLAAHREHAGLCAKLPAARRALAAGAGSPTLLEPWQAMLAAYPEIAGIGLVQAGGEVLASVGDPPVLPVGSASAQWRGERLDYRADIEGTGAAVVLSVRTEPLLAAVRSFRTLPGASTFLFDAAGTYLAHQVRAKEQRSLVTDDAEAARILFAGTPSARSQDALLMAEPISAEPPLWLGLRVPDASLDAEVFPQGADYVRNVLVMMAAAVLLAAAYFFLQGVVDRALLLRETERYLERIRGESRRYRALLEGAADLVVIVDPLARTVREANGLAREALGLPATGQGAPVEALLDPAAVEALARAIERAAAAPGQVVALHGLRLRGARGPLEADARLVGIDLEDGQVVQVALRDMTLQRQMERKLATADRLSALGLLTAGVAHEINNPLEGIGNYLTLLEREDQPAERRRRHLEQVRHGFGRIGQIVRGLLDFVRPGVERGQADLGDVARRAHELVRYAEELRAVEVEFAGLEPGRVVVEGDPGRLEQIVVNLLLNAGQAMGGRGRIRLRARREADGEVVLNVDDSGPGIPPERLESLFDPFYSAGADGSPRGTGLGLSVSYGIARAHGGSLAAENLPGGGARFTLRLPTAGTTIGSQQ